MIDFVKECCICNQGTNHEITIEKYGKQFQGIQCDNCNEISFSLSVTKQIEKAKAAYLHQFSKKCHTCECKISENISTNWHDTPECLTCKNNPYKMLEVKAL